MPIVAPHNLTYRSEGHVPSDDWPSDCLVQWGGSGIVLKRDGGSYGTAFFEAFPSEGGFFRGEGENLVAAEAACLSKYLRFTRCDHLWGRGSYTNGGAICRRCGAFMTRFRPILTLGEFRDPIRVMELELAMSGACRPSRTEEAGSVRYGRKIRLRLARAGIKLPELEDPDYEEGCRSAILSWYRENRNVTDPGASDGVQGLFDRMALRRLEMEVSD